MNSNNKGLFWTFWFPLIVAILLYCTGDVLLKIGNFEIQSTFSSLIQGDFWADFITNSPIIFAFALALLSRLIVGYIFSKNPLGFTEGIFLAIAVIFSYILGFLIFNERIYIQDIFAICFILIGILFIYSSTSHKNILE